MLDLKTKDLCRICARELYGNQRRWIFNPTAKQSLQVLLSHAVGRQLSRDGRREFACSKCAFMLDRMYRFDTVIARVEALSIERMQKLLLEKERLRQCVSGLYHKNNSEETELSKSVAEASILDTPAPSNAKYSFLLEEDLTYSVYECWAEHGTGQHQQAAHHQHHHQQFHSGSEAGTAQRSRKCRGCKTLRVADSDYEAICKVPRKVGRSISCGPSTRHSASNLASTEPCSEAEACKLAAQSSSLTEICQTVETAEEENVSLSPATSIESLDATGDPSQLCSLVHSDLLQGQMEDEKVMTQSSSLEQSPKTGLELVLSLVKSFEYHPVTLFRGSRLPVPIKPVSTHQIPQATNDCPFSLQSADMVPLSIQQELQMDLAEIEALWMDDYVPCAPHSIKEKLIGEQQVQLVQYENAAGQCVSELQKAQMKVQTLQTEIRKSEAINKELQERLGVMEAELLSIRETARGQERTIQTLSDSLSTKDHEIADLHQLTEEQKQLLISLTRQNQEHLQTSITAPIPELVELQVSLFSTQLELQSRERVQRQMQRREDQLTRTTQHLLADLQEEQHHRQEAEKHNQELLVALQRARSNLERMEEKRNEGLRDKEIEIEEKDRSIRELKNKLQHKDHLLNDYTDLLEGQKEAGGNRDVLIRKLKLRIQDRDRALERAVDEKFACVEQREAEVYKLQRLLREKERDLQNVRSVLVNNQETINSLEMLLRGKSVELEQVSESWRSSQRVQREFDDRHKCSLRERDTLISLLQTTLQTHTKENEEFTAALFSKLPPSSSELVEKLKSQLKVQERLFQELLTQHSRQTQEHDAHIQELLNAMGTREQCVKDVAERAGHVMTEQAARVQELRRQVVSARSRSPSSPVLSEDVQFLQEELQLSLSKHRETQRELSILRSTLATSRDRLQTQTAQLSTLSHTSDAEEAVSIEMEQTASSQADTGDSTSEVEHEEEEDGAGEFTGSTEEEEQYRVTAHALTNMQGYKQYERVTLPQAPMPVDSQGLTEVKLLVEQKQAVERELWELKAQLEKAGFTSLSQMRKALLSLCLENEELRKSTRTNKTEEEIHRPLDEQGGSGVQPQPCENTKRNCPGAPYSHATQAVQQNLEGNLKVCKTPTRTPAEKPRDYMETPVKHNSKQVQVDQQDLGYETSGRSENEAERDDTSSPEFDDLELCTSLSCPDEASQWWSDLSVVDQAGDDASSLQRQVEYLQVQLSRSQALVLSLQTRPQDTTPNSSPQKSDREDRELRELMTRVTSLEEQLRKGKSQTEGKKEEAVRSSSKTGKFDTLIQAQARELSHLRQRMREGQNVCHILTQHLGDTTKSFEELLRANDIDYYMSQSFREQLAQSSALALRVHAKISSRDYSEVTDDRKDHELLAIRLSKELQQKDKLIESLRNSKLGEQLASAPPTRSPSFTGDAEHLEQASFLTNDQDSNNEDLDLCSELDDVSEFGQEDVDDDSLRPAHPNSSKPPSVSSSHGHQSSSICPSVHCSPPRLMDGQTELTSAPLPPSPQCHFTQMAFQPFNPHTQHPRLRSITPGGFSLAEVHQELQKLQRQLAHNFTGAQVKPLPAVFQLPDHLTSQHAFQHAPFASPNVIYEPQQKRGRAYNDVSSSSFGYQSGIRHTETHLMEEHLREIRSLHRRLEESIQTNERLRQQLAERLDSKIKDGGAPTNIYIQGLDSVSQLSNEVRVLREDNQALQSQLQQASREVEQLRDAAVFEHTRLKQAELEVEKWAGQFRQLRAQLQEQTQAVQQLKQDKQMSQENTNRLQHEVHVLQQRLSESSRLVQTLQCELQIHQKLRSTTHNESEDSPLSPPVREAGLVNPASSSCAQRQTCVPVNPRTRCYEAEVSDGSFVHSTGNHVMGHWDDFSVLQQQLLEGKMLICKMEVDLQNSVEINLHKGRVSNMQTSIKTLKGILEKMCSVLNMFWKTAPNAKTTTAQKHKEQTLTEEVVSLKHKLAEREKTLRDTLETLKDSNSTKDSMEQFIFSQLSRTRDVLKKARTNLEKNEHRINSLGCSFSLPATQSISFTPSWATRGEVSNPGGSSSSGSGIMTTADHHSHKSVSWVGQHVGTRRPLQTFCNSTRSALRVASAPVES